MDRLEVSISTPLKEWIKSQVGSGKYPDANAYIGELIRRDQEAVETLRAALVEAEESGMSDDTLEDIWKEVKARHNGV